MPAGSFDAPYGAMEGKGPWYIDGTIAARVLTRVASRVNDMLIDYEHQSLLTEKNGKEAPAAGWASRSKFVWREGKGLYLTDPGWTAKASQYIAGDEYRYISPVFTYDKNTGEVLDILSIALTNNPALDGMDPVELKAAAKQLTQTHEETSMNEELRLAILSALGLAANSDITDEELMAKASASLTDLNSQVATLTAAAEKHDEAIAAAKAGDPDPAKYVPVAAVETLKTDIAALTKKVTDNEKDDLIETGLSEGKLLPAQEEWARSLDVAALSAYLDNASGVAALSGHQSTGKKFDKEGKEELTEQELAVCKATGIEPEDYRKTKAALAS